MTQPEPEEDVGPGPLPQSHHPLYPQLVQHRDEAEAELGQAGEGEVPRQVLALRLLAGQGDVQEDRPVPDLLHVVAGDPGDQAGVVAAHVMQGEEDGGLLAASLQLPLHVDRDGAGPLQADDVVPQSVPLSHHCLSSAGLFISDLPPSLCLHLPHL